MANTPRSGADGTSIALGFQTGYGSKITNNDDMIRFPTGHPSAGKIKMFPCSAIDFSEEAETVDSNLITALGADVETEIGRLHHSGGWTTGVLIEDIAHFLAGVLNPVGEPSSTALVGEAYGGSPTLANPEVAMAKIGTSGNAFKWASQFQITGGTRASDANMLIKGFTRGGRVDSDRLYHEERVPVAGAEPVKSQTFWQEIIEVTLTGITGSPTYQWVPDTYYTKIGFSTILSRFLGWTIMWLKGGSPGVCADVVPFELSFSASETGIDLTINCLGTRGEQFRTIEGGEVQQVSLNANDYALAGLTRSQGWGGAFSFGGEIVKYVSLDFSVNLNYVPSRGIDATRFRRGVSPDSNRQVLVIPTTEFTAPEEASDVFRNWQQIFRNSTKLPAKYEMFNFGAGGRTRKVVASFANMQINESPPYEVGGQGPIDQRVAFKALPTTSSASEIEFEIFSENEYSRG